MLLDLEIFNEKISVLEKSVILLNDTETMSKLDLQVQNLLKAGIIKYYDTILGLSLEYLRKWLNFNLSPFIAEGISYKGLIRLACENTLLDDFEKWVHYRECAYRSFTENDLETNNETLKSTKMFAVDARRLYKTLESKND